MILPGFNSDRSKLFFFFNQEFLPRTNPGNLERRTMPTALERQGDFSQSFDSTGALIVIRDPQTGQPFPGNRIPANRIDANGQAHAEPVSAAQPHGRPAGQLHLPERVRAAAQRPGGARGLEHRPEHQLLHARQLGLRGLQGRLGLRAQQRQLAAVADCLRDSQLRRGEHAAAHVQPDAGGRSHRRPQSRQADGRAAHRSRSRSQRSEQRRSRRPAELLPRSQSRSDRPERQLRRGRPEPGQHAHAGRRGALPVLRRERHLEHVDEHDQDRRLAQPQGRRVHRVHDAPGGAVDGVQRRVQLRSQHRQPARRQPSVRQRHPGIGQLVFGSHRPPGRQLAVQPTSSGSSRTAGASSATSRSTPASASTGSGRRRARATSCPCSCPSGSTRRRRRC